MKAAKGDPTGPAIALLGSRIGEERSEQVGADLKRAVYATSARELHFPDGVYKIE